MSKDKKMREELAKIEEANATEEFKKRVIAQRQASRAVEKDEALKETYTDTTDSKGNKLTYWDEFKQKADRMLSSEVNSYNDWRSSMNSLLSLYASLAYAVRGSLATADFGIKGIIDQWFIPTRPGSSEIDLPALRHNVSMGADGKLNIASLTRLADNLDDEDNVAKAKRAQFTQCAGDLNKLFEEGVVQWLKNGGYTSTVAEPMKFSKDGVALNTATFDALKNDPELGLSHYLDANVEDLSFTPSVPTPRGP